MAHVRLNEADAGVDSPFTSPRLTVPLGQRPPGSVLVGEDVDYFLL